MSSASTEFSSAISAQASNAGVISVVGDTLDAIRFDNNNGITNSGTITTTGVAAHGFFGNGSNNSLVNTGTINVLGLNAHGISSLGNPLGPITNSGVITAAGPGGLGVFRGGPATFTNTATGSITGEQASGVIANGGGTITNAGTIVGQITGITSVNGAATITNSGTITGLTAPGLVSRATLTTPSPTRVRSNATTPWPMAGPPLCNSAVAMTR